LLTRRKFGKYFYDKLTLGAIDWQTFAVKPLLVLPDQVETKISLSPDGLELLLDRVVAKKSEPVTGYLRTDGPSAIAQSSLMLLTLKKNLNLMAIHHLNHCLYQASDLSGYLNQTCLNHRQKDS
jgi:hypothetical protein